MLRILLFGLLGVAACKGPQSSTTTGTTVMNTNELTEKEKSEGWKSLFNGKTTEGWHRYGDNKIGKAWKVVDGTLHLDAASKKDWQTAEGGDIVTEDNYKDFHLKLEWKIATNGNSGIIFYVHEDTAKFKYPWQTGPEMQVLDNAGHPDAKIIKHRAGDLYDLISAKETVRPANEWNSAEIIAQSGNLRFRLNGEEVLQTQMWTDAWRQLIAGSKFKNMSGFGMYREGKIALQDHGDDVWYRNIKIRKL